MKFFLLFIVFITSSICAANFPVLFQGRIRPFEAIATLQEEKESDLWEKHFLQKNPITALPGQQKWFSLEELHNSQNFTIYPNEDFYRIKDCYLCIHENFSKGTLDTHLIEALSFLLKRTYSSNLSGKTVIVAKNSLNYPYLWQIELESIYYKFPFINLLIVIYAAAFFSFLFTKSKKTSLILIACGLLLNTALLLFRTLILMRPPVANMAETMIYVPWVIVFTGFVLYWLYTSRTILALSSIASAILLTLLQVFSVDHSLENVQPVLNSKFWLIIHVLMIVASYGVFIFAGLLGHLYLIKHLLNHKHLEKLTKYQIKAFYIGLTLLIPGTILGGIWAAQSWGRFWDWDPKESWAFISAGTYLFFVHAYRYKKITDFGLAIGSVIGLISISFTWYGVNYILGTGLHSYGFGSGGELKYLLYVSFEILFILASLILRLILKKQHISDHF